jgi:hypothetical protein
MFVLTFDFTVTTPDPKRVNDEDLGRSLLYTERAPHELTDVDFFTVSDHCGPAPKGDADEQTSVSTLCLGQARSSQVPARCQQVLGLIYKDLPDDSRTRYKSAAQLGRNPCYSSELKCLQQATS